MNSLTIEQVSGVRQKFVFVGWHKDESAFDVRDAGQGWKVCCHRCHDGEFIRSARG